MLRSLSNVRTQGRRIVGLISCHDRTYSTAETTSTSTTGIDTAFNPAADIVTRQESLSAPFRCVQNDPVRHDFNHEAQFYGIPIEDYKRLFTFGGVSKEQQRKMKAFNEFCLMVRTPALEVIRYLQLANYAHPVNRYVMYGVIGSGKSTSLAHVIHFCSKLNWLIVHLPWAPLYVRVRTEVVQSTYKENRIDLPIHAVAWLQHFKLQNSDLLQTVQPKISNTYTWSKREVTEAGSLLTDIIEHGINRVKFSSDCVGAVLKEIKLFADLGVFKVLVAVDGVNAMFGNTRLKREDRSPVTPNDISLMWNFRKMLRSDWKNGAVVTTVDPLGSHSVQRESHLPRYLLNTEGFELMDPFIPISVENYSLKEINSCLDYFIDRRWIQSESGKTKEGRDQLMFLSGYNPKKLSEVCGPC